jgi:hypothetical protein
MKSRIFASFFALAVAGVRPYAQSFPIRGFCFGMAAMRCVHGLGPVLAGGKAILSALPSHDIGGIDGLASLGTPL